MVLKFIELKKIIISCNTSKMPFSSGALSDTMTNTSEGHVGIPLKPLFLETLLWEPFTKLEVVLLLSPRELLWIDQQGQELGAASRLVASEAMLQARNVNVIVLNLFCWTLPARVICEDH